MSMNIFERASRMKLRFPSTVGALTTEQLWDLPLTAKASDKADLDKIARTIHFELKDTTEVSFVNSKPDRRKTEMELQLEIVKHVIASKVADREATEKAAATAERKRKLLGVLAHKEEQELVGMTKEQIEAEIIKLSA